jgi:DNA-binding NtrC family response regulator
MTDSTLVFVARPEAVSHLFSELKAAGYAVALAENLQGALKIVSESSPAAVFSQPRLKSYRVEELLDRAGKEGETFPPVVVFSDQGTAAEAKAMMEQGAADYWLTLNGEKIMALAAGSKKTSRVSQARQAVEKNQEIVGGNQAMQQVLALARQVARSKATVLISGESGTGKELIARYIHNQSDRRTRPFVAVNCAALPEHLLESELFGHEKGAFTGAVQRKPGRFELAHGGTILLDEITEMDLALQAKLLRVLQESEIDRVGGTETIKVDVRVLATTNRNIAVRVKEGGFREDLYYRLNVIPLTLPPLRERGQDVLRLTRFFLHKFAAVYSMPESELSPEAEKWLLGHEWPGNVRELQNLMERAVLLSGSGPVRPGHFLLDSEEMILDGDEGASSPEQAGADRTEERDQEQRDDDHQIMPLQEMEKRMILKSLDQTAGNRTRAAELLGISVRTLRNKLNEYRQDGLSV